MPLFKRYYNGTTVSRDLPAGEYSWDQVVIQSGRPVLDAEPNLAQEVAAYNGVLTATQQGASGFYMRGAARGTALTDYVFGSVPNSFTLPRLQARVAGMPVVVDYTGTVSPNLNVVQLAAATPAAGIAPDVKRTDFVFLEVWRAPVAPSPRAQGTCTVASPQTIADGDTWTVDATGVGGPVVVFTARNAPALATEFQIGGSAASTASALAARINDPVNGLYSSYVAARTGGTAVATLSATFGGSTGNLILIASSAPANLTASGPALLGGANVANKPTQNQIYRLGNVASPAAVALDDNMIDPILGVESAQRIQVQYRLRSYSSAVAGINPKTQPDGFSNGAVLAQGATGAPVATYPFVPADNNSGALNSDAKQYGFVDPGLWVAGDGSAAAATALGTADGFVYAIPVCFVFRRNDATLTGGFNPTGNANGALASTHGPLNNTNLAGGPYAIAPTKSDRPDGFFHDVIVGLDVLDLRRFALPTATDYRTQLLYEVQSLMDKDNVTWQVDGSDLGGIADGSGDVSTYPLACDEIGRTDTVAGDLVRKFDHVARRFGSQAVVERVVFEVLPTGAHPAGIAVTKSGGTVAWHEDDLVSIDFTALNPTTLQSWLTPAVGGATVAAYWPTGTRVTDVLGVYHDDGYSVVAVDQAVQLKTVVGVGTHLLEFTLDANGTTVDGGGTVVAHPMVGTGADDGSLRRLFVELEVSYPTGAGLTRTPDVVPVPNPGSGYAPYEAGPVVEADPTQRPPEMDATWVPSPRFREGFREVLLEQKSAPGGGPVTDSVVSIDAASLRTPRRVYASATTTVNGWPVLSTTAGSSERLVNVNPLHALAGQVVASVTYYPQDPVPSAGAVGYQLDVYYRGQAPQTAGTQAGALPPALLPETLTVEVLAAADSLWTGQSGKGSAQLGFPYANPLDQIPTVDLGGGLPKEWFFAASADIAVSDFNAATGLLNLHSLVQVDTTAPLQLGTGGRGPRKDGEFRAYWDYANPGGYKPTAMAPPLAGAARHKAFTALLVRPCADTLLFRRGDVLVAVISQLHELSTANTIVLDDSPSVCTSVALYRTRNRLIGPYAD